MRTKLTLSQERSVRALIESAYRPSRIRRTALRCARWLAFTYWIVVLPSLVLYTAWNSNHPRCLRHDAPMHQRTWHDVQAMLRRELTAEEKSMFGPDRKWHSWFTGDGIYACPLGCEASR